MQRWPRFPVPEAFMSALRFATPLLALVVGAAGAAAAQAPTLPSDTLEANFAPRATPRPAPEAAPSLPSDTLEAAPPPSAPDPSGASLDPEERPIPERIESLRLAASPTGGYGPDSRRLLT
jgi:hypothetical protein